jgi:hypothetical protein
MNCDSYINVPSSQTYITYYLGYIFVMIFVFTLIIIISISITIIITDINIGYVVA